MPMMSPRTQGMAAPGATSDQAKTLFEQGLSGMAYNVLINKLPNISPDVVTFKILDSDSEEGAGVGAFVVMRHNQTIYIPVVMAENQIKPLDIMYYKDMNVFLPLTKEWLEEVDKLALGELGTSVTAPPTLNTDVDIRNTVVPPTTGRYSYASDRALLGIGTMFDEAKNQTEPKLAFLSFLGKAPNRVKQAAARLFETTPRLLKQAVSFYGEKPLIDALTLRQEKIADYGAKMSRTGALYIVDKSTKPGDFKEIFGPEAPLAFSGVSLKGYFAKDSRKDLNRSMQVQPYLDLQEPKDAGAYKLWTSDGKPVMALVIGNPMNLFNDGAGRKVPARNIRFRQTNVSPSVPHQGLGERYRTPNDDGLAFSEKPFIQRYVGVTEDGKLIDAHKLIGDAVAISELEGSKVFKAVVSDVAAAGPRKGQYGIFVQRRGASFVATTPLEIHQVTDLGEGVRRIVVQAGMSRKTLIIDKNSPISKLMIPTGRDDIYMPNDFVFLPTKADYTLAEGDFLSSPEQIMKWSLQGVLQGGGEKITVKSASHGFMFGVAPKQAFERLPALRKLAEEAHISVDDADHALKLAAERGKFEFWVLSPPAFSKVAAYLKTAAGEAPPADPAAGGAPQGQDPNAPPMDPAQAAMQGVQGAPMAPQAPAPVDMAVAEAMQNLMMQQQGLQSQMTLLQQIQQRTNMIAGGGGAMGSPAAAAAAMGGPMDPSMMGGGAAPMQPGPGGVPPAGGAPDMPPPPGGAPGPGGVPVAPGPPGAMGAPAPAPAPGGAQPPLGMAMQQGGGPQAAVGGMQPGMDPSQQQQQPPPAMMNADDGSVESIMNQVNPQFMQQAGQLNDAGTFDAAALSSMAQTPALKDLVGAYVPNLEKSLDNIGRVLLSLWMDESRIKEDIGTETYIGLEDNLRTVFKGMGDLILKINQNTAIMRGPNDRVPSEQ